MTSAKLADRARKKVEQAERRREVFRLWSEGLIQQEIAVELDVSNATISRDMRFIRERFYAEATKDYADWLGVELAKLERDEGDLRTALRGEGVKISHELAIRDRIMRIQERRAKLLGLDGAVKVAFTDPTGKHSVFEPLSPAQIRAAVEAVNGEDE